MTLHSGDNQTVRSSVPVVSRRLWPGNMTFFKVASMVVTSWIVAFFQWTLSAQQEESLKSCPWPLPLHASSCVTNHNMMPDDLLALVLQTTTWCQMTWCHIKFAHSRLNVKQYMWNLHQQPVAVKLPELSILSLLSVPISFAARTNFLEKFKK